MNNKKFILDACCGSKMMWFDRNNPNCLYIDIRKEDKGFIETKPALEVNPDIIADFRNLPEEILKMKFKLIVWDIPHLTTLGLSSIYRKQYGCLNAETWPKDLSDGFKNLWSVLDDFGVLLLKFNDFEIKFESLLSCFSETPLFFNMFNSSGEHSTKWFCFMKIPKEHDLNSQRSKTLLRSQTRLTGFPKYTMP